MVFEKIWNVRFFIFKRICRSQKQSMLEEKDSFEICIKFRTKLYKFRRIKDLRDSCFEKD